MAGIQNFVEYCEDFLGTQVFSPTAASNNGHQMTVTDTSSAGAPTYASNGINGELTLTLAADNEVEYLTIDHGDKLNFDIDLIQSIEMRVKNAAATLTSGTSLAFGLSGARNDAIDSIAQAACFRVIGADSTTAIVVETDDGTNDNDDVATGEALVAAYRKFVINFAAGTDDVRFFIDGARVAASTTFDMSNYTAGLQPFIQLQKAANTNADAVAIDYFKIVSKRS